jgi:predicted tellurium resistance membrane protein TerC
MVGAVTISMFIMLMFSKKISEFINNNPTVEMLALSFLILIGFMLILEGVSIEVPKAYIYFAVFFSFAVELLNLKMRKTKTPDKIKHSIK